MESARVTTNGRLTIPVGLRRRHHMRAGTRVVFIEEEGKVMMQPVTPEYIRSFCGIFKRKSGAKSVLQELREDRAEEKRREEDKGARCSSKSARRRAI